MSDCVKLAKLGRRWKSDPEKDTCEQCTSLNGQEFYNDPRDGQQSIHDMPQRPLHPNCRCTTEVIFECVPNENGSPTCVSLNFTNPDLSEIFFDKTVYALGLVWRDGEITKGPIYGNHGGEDWCNGKDWKILMSEAESEADGNNVACTDDYKYDYYNRTSKPAIDDLDEAFKEHDDGYVKN